MAEQFNSKNKPAVPAPPLNAVSAPKTVKPENSDIPERWKPRASVYEEIAERRKSERHSIGVTPPELRDETQEAEDIKVYTPSNKKKSKAVRITDEELPPELIADENLDVPPIPKAKKKIGAWIAVIIALSILSAGAVIAYLLVNGYFDGLISML